MKFIKEFKESINKWNLFIDDERVPFSELRDGSAGNMSAYHYTRHEPLKEKEWVVVRDFDEFVKEVKERGVENLEIVSFDHDLADIKYSGGKSSFSYKEKTGYDCAKWLCSFCQENNVKFPKYFVHSMNPIGGENIKSYIDNYIKHVEN